MSRERCQEKEVSRMSQKKSGAIGKLERVAKGKRCQRQEILRKEKPNEKHAKTVDKDKSFGYWSGCVSMG